MAIITHLPQLMFHHSRSPRTHQSSVPLSPDPLDVSIATQCESLKALVMEWEERRGGGGREGGERGALQLTPETRKFLGWWLTGTESVSVC